MVDTRHQLGAPQVPHFHSSIFIRIQHFEAAHVIAHRESPHRAVAPGDLAHDETLWDQTLRL